MKTEPEDLKVRDVLDLKSQQMLVVNSEYQRGEVWKLPQKKKLVDSVLRGYPIPLIYFHHIQQEAGTLRSERFEVIDGQSSPGPSLHRKSPPQARAAGSAAGSTGTGLWK